MNTDTNETKVLPHHEQQTLCTTRLPYRQGRKLTAVKVYSIVNESNHLLVFGVPSLNLRQEAKSLFQNYDSLSQFTITKGHAVEEYTETYHAVYENIQSARLAKKFLDGKNFYGGILHISYAPEYENIEETKRKLSKRQFDVAARLKNLHKESVQQDNRRTEIVNETENSTANDNIKLNMGDINKINVKDKTVKRKKLINNEVILEKKYKPCFVQNVERDLQSYTETKITDDYNIKSNTENKTKEDISDSNNIEIINCTSTDVEVITNINEHLNYNRFGNEIVKEVKNKPLNRITFNVNNKKLL